MYHKHYSETPYSPIWDAIIREWIGSGKFIIDFGCGVGQFAAMLYDIKPTNTYTGVDFSKEAIAIAEKRYLPNSTFVCARFNKLTKELLQGFDIVLILETLEHLPKDEDLQLLSRLDRNQYIIFTVPNYISGGHYRIFGTLNDVKLRYGKWVTILKTKTFKINSQGNKIFSVLGKIR